MTRSLYNLATAVSLVLCVATFVAWKWTGPGPHAGGPPAGWAFLTKFGFRWKVVGVHEVPYEPIYGTNVPKWWYAAIALITALLPTLRLAGSIRTRIAASRATSLGRCPVCGYDLRASKGRCPECGTSITPNAGTPA
jgi:hypothetical protein